jgi:hypothetical protein
MLTTNSHGSLTKMPNIQKQIQFNTPSSPIATKVVSATPGRLRLRIAHSHRQPETMEYIANTLDAQPHVDEVRTNVNHGSIVIKYSGKSGDLSNVLATLEDIGIIFAEITEGGTEASTTVSTAVVDLNKRVRKATDGVVDIRFLFPLGLGILAIRKLMMKGLQFDIIPWYVLAWYSFDSFIKLHGITPQKPSNNAGE